jgi:hypothetical protein
MAPYIITRHVSSVLLLLMGSSGSAAFAPEGVPGRRDAPSSTVYPSDEHRTPWSSSLNRRRIRLYTSRDNDRARMEKNWEDMMGDDWREFRARLVARERASVGGEPKQQQQQQQQRTSEIREDASSSTSSSAGGIFGAITSMFSSKGGESSSSDAATATRAKKTRGKDGQPPADIFDGSAVGGATRFSKIGMSSSSYTACSDPFMDEEECHIIHDEPNVRLDRHRWAHPLYHVEPGCILVANEKLGGVFHQTVVLIIDHNEAVGSTGMVINRCVRCYHDDRDFTLELFLALVPPDLRLVRLPAPNLHPVVSFSSPSPCAQTFPRKSDKRSKRCRLQHRPIVEDGFW